MPRNESNRQPPAAIDRAGMYSIDIQEIRQNFKAVVERIQRVEAAQSAHTKTLASVLDAYNASSDLFRAMTERLEQLTARVEHQREQHATDAKETRASLATLRSELPANLKSLLDTTANTLVVAQQDLATIVQRELRSAASLPGRGGAPRPTTADGGSATPVVDAVPSIDAVLASLSNPRPQATTRHGRRNWLAGRVHIIEVRLTTSGRKPVTSLAGELKQAIDDIRRLRAKSHIAVAAIPASLHALTQTDSTWQVDAKQHEVFVLEPQHLANFIALVNARGKGNETAADGLRLDTRLMEIGEELRAVPGTETLRTKLAAVITDIAPSKNSRPSQSPIEEAPLTPSPLPTPPRPREPGRKDARDTAKVPEPASQPSSIPALLHDTLTTPPADIFDSTRKEHQHQSVEPSTVPTITGTHTQKWVKPDPVSSSNPRT